MKKMDPQANLSLAELLSLAVEKTAQLSSHAPVVGDPVEENGVIVLPVSKSSVGIAGGGMERSDGKKQDAPSGVGAKVSRDPVAMLVIDSAGRVSLLPVPKETGPSRMEEAIVALAGQIRETLKAKADKKKEKKDTK